jgi:DNA-binding MarR family transcriptional regulator
MSSKSNRSKSPRNGSRRASNGSPLTGNESQAHLKSARQVFDSIRRIVRVLRLSARHTEKAFGLSAAQLFVLHKLAEGHRPQTPSELAEKALTDQSSVSVVVQRLVDRGYVLRTRSARDGRSFDLTLTDTGRRIVRKSPDSTQDRLLGAMLKMPPARTKQLADLMEELVGHCGIASEEATMLLEDETAQG